MYNFNGRVLEKLWFERGRGFAVDIVLYIQKKMLVDFENALCKCWLVVNVLQRKYSSTTVKHAEL